MKLRELPFPFMIADVGSNWKTSNNQSDNLIMAKRHIHDAAMCGASAVKFQLFTDKELYGMEGPNQWSLPPEWLVDLAAYATSQDIEFMCSAFSPQGYHAVNQFVNIHKVASCEMKHVGIYEALELHKKPVLISNGGANEAEVRWLRAHLTTLELDSGFLECAAKYPAKAEDYNLRVLHDPMYVGVSDHTKNNVVALTSVGFGAKVFEKHFTAFDFPGISTPDFPVSIGPAAMAQYCREIKEAFSALGDGHKVVRPCEKDITTRHRRRLKVIQPIKSGERLVFDKNYGIYRSIADDCEAGAPEMWKTFDGGIAKRNLEPGDPVWTSTVECRN